MKTYLVTGSNGFVGTVLTRMLLEQGNKVIGFDNCWKGEGNNALEFAQNPNYNFVKGNVCRIRDLEPCIQQADVVINLAALVGINACTEFEELVLPVNVGGVQNIVDLLNKYPGKVLLQASTDSVFGIVDRLSNEDTIPNPQSLYGKSKLEAEKVIENNCKNYKYIILRFSTGCSTSNSMRHSLLVHDLVFNALENKVITVFQKGAYRTFIAVSDMSRALIHFSLLALKGENRYNLYCVGEDSMNFTKGELAELVKKKTGCMVLYVESNTDKDCRDYKIDHSRLYESGFKCEMSMEQVIDGLIKIYPQMNFKRD